MSSSPSLIPDCTGVLLAGGRAERMGGLPKGLLLSGGEPLVGRSLRLLGDLFQELLIVTNDPAPYAGFGVRTVPDILAGRGAPGGLHAALGAARTGWIFLAGCDMPWLSRPGIELMARERGETGAVAVLWRGHLEPFHSFWSRRSLDEIERRLARETPSLGELARAVGVHLVGEERWSEVDPQGSAFANANTPEEAARLQLRLPESPPLRPFAGSSLAPSSPSSHKEQIVDLTQFVADNRQRYVDELIQFLKIPSISSSSQHAAEVARAADHLRAEMERLGLESKVIPTAGHPVVFGQWKGADEGRPTVLVYGHYDVQPVDPLALWKSPPFEPQIRDGQIYARGATDDKGQIWMHLKAFEAWRQAGGPPVNMKMVFEGEEEVGSAHFGQFLEANLEMLRADAVVISDTTMFARGLPSIGVGLRGLCYLQVNVEGPSSDLHSGGFGGAVNNPANALARIIAQLQDEDGKVLIPGFYDRVRQVSPREARGIRSLPFSQKTWLAGAGSPPAPWGEKRFHILERLWMRPTLDVNGIWGGFQGEGAKTVIPSKAGAKISMRLVPDQSPEEIERKFKAYVKKISPRSVRVEVENLHGGAAFLAPADHPALQATSRALERSFGRKPVFIREGGSIPITTTLQKAFQAPVILMGFGLADENAHAPNERFDLENYQKGILSAAYLLEELVKPVEATQAPAKPHRKAVPPRRAATPKSRKRKG
jgi:acetylornithine deacetylase/succinyl-diaminopimelate desuccinylase-like protein/molybdopterin-guanine dinucleotide biosynthesis protein A